MHPTEFTSIRAGRVTHVATHGSYYAFVPNPLPPTLEATMPLWAALSEADHALGQLAGAHPFLRYPHFKLLPSARRAFVHQEAVMSSRIEGTEAGLSDLYVHETGAQYGADLARDTREVHNYVLALEYGIERVNTLPLSRRLLCEVHAILMEGVRGERMRPGEFRQEPVYIGSRYTRIDSALFVPPPVPEMHAALDAFERFLHAPSDLPPLVRVALAHYQFEAIHPFLDGNGRIGRLLITLLLCEWKLLPDPLLYLSAYFEAYRREYYDSLLAVSQHGAFEAWLRFFLHGVKFQAQDAVARLHRLHELRESYRQRVQSSRAAERLAAALDVLFGHPVVTIPFLAREMNVGFRSAQRYVEALTQAGVLRELTGRARDREYIADRIIQTIEEPLPIEGRALWDTSPGVRYDYSRGEE